MDSLAGITNAVSTAIPGSVQGAAAVAVLKKGMNMQAASAAQLIAGLPQLVPPALASSGHLGTQLNAYG